MNALWSRLSAKIGAWSVRERLMVVTALAVTIVALFLTLYIDPAQRRAATLGTQIEQQRTELRTLRASAESVQKPRADDAQSRARQELQRQIRESEEKIRQLQASLVPAGRMNALVQELLTRESGLQLMSLRTLSTTALLAGDKPLPVDKQSTATRGAQSSPASAPGIYKHGVELTVRGSYAALYSYLTRLERSRSRMFWWRARLSTDTAGPLTMTLTIYTLSLDKTWLQV